MIGPARHPAPLVSAGPGADIDSASGDVTNYLAGALRLLWRRKGLILGTAIVVTTITALVVFQLTPVYTATTAIMLERQEAKVVDIEAVLSGLPIDRETIQSEVEVLRSRGMARRVIAELDLESNPEFNRVLRPPSFVDEILDVERYLPEEISTLLLSGAAFENKTTAVSSAERQSIDVLNEYLDALDVRPERNSRVISIAVRSENPRTAAEIANKLADRYLVQQLEAKFEATQRATSWLSERLGDLETRLARSEGLVETFRKDAGLVRGDSTTLASQQITELNTELVLARSKRAEAEARLRQIEELLKSSDGVGSAAEVLASPLIQRLLEQEAEVLRRVAELSSEFGEKHPRMIKVRAERRDLRTKIEGEVQKIVQNLRNEVAVVRAREASLRGSVKQLENKVAGLNEKEVRLRALQREASADRTLYETFLSRFKETGAQEDLQQTDARIISEAAVPLKPSFPRKGSILASAGVFSLLLGVFLAFLLEQFDSGFRSLDQIERLAAIRGLALIPELGRFSGLPERYVVERPASAYGEAIRSLYTGLLLTNVGEPPKVVLVSSAVPKEGKSTVALSLARLVARSGKRVLVIEGDVRRPTMARRLGLPREPGLIELLNGEIERDQVVRVDEATGAHVIPAGRGVKDPAELLAGAHMADMLARARDEYEVVVMDSPPVLAVSDARVLAQYADATVFVVRWASTRREAVAGALHQLRQAGCELAGVALSMVNVRAHARYGYSDSGYYYGASRRYYQS